MKYPIFSSSIIPILLCFVSQVNAIVCSNNSIQNIAEVNHFILHTLDNIYPFTKNIRNETISIITYDKANNPVSNSKQSLIYNQEGFITDGSYDLYSPKNELLYTERLKKIENGWENIITDFEDKRNSIVNYKIDDQNRIYESNEIKKAFDFVFLSTNHYTFDDNSCLINKKTDWKLREINRKGKFTGVNENGSSQSSFHYKDHHLDKVVYNFNNKKLSENNIIYQYDENNHQVFVKVIYSTQRKNTFSTMLFKDFNEHGDWMSAKRLINSQDGKYNEIKRTVAYF